MLNKNDLYKSFQEIDDDILERSEVVVKKNKKPVWQVWGTLAACFVIAMFMGTSVFSKIWSPGGGLIDDTPNGDSMYDIMNDIQSRYKDFDISSSEISIIHEWPWEYQPIYEQYPMVIFNKKEYQTKTRGVDSVFVASIDASLIGDVLGTCKAVGYDKNTDKTYEREFEVRQISGISPELMIAVEMDGCCYVFKECNDEYNPPKTFGELLDSYGLSQTLNLSIFRIEGKSEKSSYKLNDDEYIWEVLSSCADAEFAAAEDNYWIVDAKGISFSATSEALGIYKQAFMVTEDGYIWTNIFEYGYRFFIGEEAANKIISYAKEEGAKIKAEPYTYWIAGALSEVGEDYILIDDSVLCSDEEDGMVFRISTDDMRIKRYIELEKIKIGDVFLVSFSGTLDAETGEIEVGHYFNITTSESIYISSDGDINILE